ncbi:hypothetical protein FSP39_009712, partial [Pinctada imbricata]
LFKKAMSTSIHCLIISRKCKQSCLSGYTLEDVKKARMRVWTKNYEERVEWFSEKYSEAINKQKMIKFTVDNGQHVCGTCFRNLYRLDKTFYYKQIGYFEHGAVAAGFQKSKSICDSTDKLIDWLKDYSAFHGDKMPDKGITLLPYKTRKVDIYNVYEEEQIEKMERVVSQATFYRVWDEHFEDLKIKKVHLSFLYVGHTHEDIDAGFSKIADTLRRNEAGTIPRLLSLIPNMKQLRGLYDIKSWISPSLNVFSHHTKPHHFRFSKDGNNIKTEYKGNHNSIWRQFPSSILKHPPGGIPKILLPQAIHKFNLEAIDKNIDRAKFLFTDQSQVSWWKRFITYLTDVKSCPQQQKAYAKEGARWLLPLLPKQQEVAAGNQQASHIDPGLHEMVDKELDEPMVTIFFSDYICIQF